MSEEIYVCSVCGERMLCEDVYYFEDEVYCSACLDEMTIVCDHCGERVRESDAVTDDNTSLCNRCYENNYYSCENCGTIIAADSAYYLDNDEEYPYCYSCYERERRNRNIHDYNYKPDPLFYGNGSRFFGVELEVDEGGKDEYNASEILCMANDSCHERLYIKCDGSLDDGMELVTHPMTLDYHKNSMPWQKIMQRLIGLGYRSHKTGTCGLHCHINRDSFGNNPDEQEYAIARVLYFVEHHWAELLKFSRRSENQMQRWANRYGMKNQPSEFIKDVKSRNSSRYVCINLQNYNTIEFRLFRGTLKYNTFIATLQLVNEICNVAVFMCDDDMKNLSWSEFVQNINKESNQELITYLKERNLYINEPIESEEEQ